MDGKGDFHAVRRNFCFIHPFNEDDTPNVFTEKISYAVSIGAA